MDPIATILAEYPVMVIDGGLATELERQGCDLRDALWSAKILYEAPERIRAVHAAYYAAGADCVISASYQATFAGFAQRGFTETQSADLMVRSVQLARDARDAFWANPANRQLRPKPLVAASIGPYGAFLANGAEYTGDYDLDLDGLIAFHRPRLQLLAGSGADLLACETIPSLQEAQALAQLLAELPGRSAWISFSARDGQHTCHGEPIAECAAWLDSQPNIAAIGINCTPPRFIPELVQAIRSATSKPIVVYPNSGEVYQASDYSWHGNPDDPAYAELAEGWYASGAQLIGGCCRTTPADIAAIASWARSGHIRNALNA
jgi:homocysteine S-methyltransferase